MKTRVNQAAVGIGNLASLNMKTGVNQAVVEDGSLGSLSMKTWHVVGACLIE